MASKVDSTSIHPDVQVINVEYPEFDISDYQQYSGLLSEYGINENDVFAIIEYGGKKSNEGISSYYTIPGGVIVVAGTYFSARQWHLTVLNAGVLDLNIQVDVHLYNNIIGLINRTIETWGWVGKGASFGRNFYGMQDIDCAVVSVIGVTSQGEYFNAGGAHYR